MGLRGPVSQGSLPGVGSLNPFSVPSLSEPGQVGGPPASFRVCPRPTSLPMASGASAPPCLSPSALAVLSFSSSAFAKSPASCLMGSLLPALPSSQTTVSAGMLPSPPLPEWVRGRVRGPEGKGRGGSPHTGSGRDYAESVTSALIRASRASACPLLPYCR